MNLKSHTRIPKKRAASQLHGRKSFRPSLPNRFFFQVLPEKGPLASNKESELGTEPLLPSPLEGSHSKVEQPETSECVQSLERKGDAQVLRQAFSLPQIKRKPAQ